VHAAAAAPHEELPLPTGALRGDVSVHDSLPTSTSVLCPLSNLGRAARPGESRDMGSAFSWNRMSLIRMVDPSFCTSAPGALVRAFCLAPNLVIGLLEILGPDR
jgi:hypothetical protein